MRHEHRAPNHLSRAIGTASNGDGSHQAEFIHITASHVGASDNVWTPLEAHRFLNRTTQPKPLQEARASLKVNQDTLVQSPQKRWADFSKNCTWSPMTCADFNPGKAALRRRCLTVRGCSYRVG